MALLNVRPNIKLKVKPALALSAAENPTQLNDKRLALFSNVITYSLC